MAAPVDQLSHSAAGRTPVALSIGGSDSGGGAGVAADLKVFARCGVHGALAITAVTAQNTTQVGAIHEVPGEVVLDQIRLVAGDLGVDAVKVGMLGGEGAARAVAEGLEELGAAVPVVVDPVLRSSTGTSLLTPQALSVLIGEILPRATVVTPNLQEARALVHATGRQRQTHADDEPEGPEVNALVVALLALGPRCVVLTGGHGEPARDRAPRPARTEPVVDVFARAGLQTVVELPGPRHQAGAEHGSGCTHSAVLAAQLALGREPLEAARRARELAGLAIAGGLREVGAGSGPVDVLGLGGLRLAELDG
jgi:hydroxymethylpyrimidine/phosphomethylpyrimidine kinase